MTEGFRDGRAGIDASLVRRLLARQFPQWADLPVTPVELDGNDNRSYRLGDDKSVRLPTAAGYVAGVEKEQRWLPALAPHLPLPIPVPLGVGAPALGYPFPWSVRRWLDGEPATLDRIDDLDQFALDVAGFLRALQAIDATGGPPAGEHTFYRGSHPSHYDTETRRTLEQLAGHIDMQRASVVWQDALESSWNEPPVWFHGDVAVGNLLVSGGRLSAVIDFGQLGVGDPACDFVIAYTLLGGNSREVFHAVVGHDDATWARARGWALWKALITLAGVVDHDVLAAAAQHRVIEQVLADANSQARPDW